MMREIDAEYYGYLDDEDDLLIPQEEKCEMAARKAKIEKFKASSESFKDNDELDTEEDSNAEKENRKI